jgi:hypothetical protein
LTGWQSFVFSVIGIVGFVPGALVLAAVSGPTESSCRGLESKLNFPATFPAIVAIMRRA